MKSQRFVHVALVSGLLWIVGCGPEVSRQTHATTAGSSGDAGAGGAAGAGGNGAGGGGAGGNGLACTKLVVQPTMIAMTALQQSSPRVGLDPLTGHVVYTFLNGVAAGGGALYAMTANAFDAWPPMWTPALMADMAVQSYALGEGPTGPVALVRHVNAPPRLIDAFVPQIHFVDTPITDEGEPLFATAIDKRFFWGHRFDTGAYDVLHLGSFQPGSIPQSEQPLLCTKSPIRALGQPSNGGFLAALLAPNAAGGCDPANPQAGTNVSIVRYDSSDVPGAPLKQSPGWGFSLVEAVVNLGLARTPDGGGWLVFQTDGSTSESIPPAMASRLTPSGYAVGDGGTDLISAGGVILGALKAAAIGDTLAAAWVDAIDPSAPTIQIQLYDLGKPLGPSTTILTNDAWYDADLQILASSEKRSLLVAWTTKSITAFARVDCVP